FSCTWRHRFSQKCAHRKRAAASGLTAKYHLFRAHGIVTIVASAWRSSKKRPKKPANRHPTTTHCGLLFVYNVYIRKSCDLSEIDRSKVAAGACARSISCRTELGTMYTAPNHNILCSPLISSISCHPCRCKPNACIVHM